MDRKSIQRGLFIVALAVSAAAQTNVTTTTSGPVGTDPVFITGTNVENSPVSVSGSSGGIGATDARAAYGVPERQEAI